MNKKMLKFTEEIYINFTVNAEEGWMKCRNQYMLVFGHHERNEIRC